jgi:hypothetical protein
VAECDVELVGGGGVEEEGGVWKNRAVIGEQLEVGANELWEGTGRLGRG